MYTALLLIHSWVRWALVALMVVSLVRSYRSARSGVAWTDTDSKLRVATVSTFDAQVLIGLLLYFGFSPMTPKTFAAMGGYMKSSALRFFTIEHVFAMLIALVALHVFSARSKRATDDAQKHRRFATGLTIAIVAVLAGIPWPGLPYARPLFRLP